MTNSPITPLVAPPTLPEVAAALMVALAEIRAETVGELEGQRAYGDLELASPEAVAAIAAVEHRLGRQLAKVEDLEPEQLTSLDSLADLLHRRWPAATPVTAGGEN